jgi:transposase-like protein
MSNTKKRRHFSAEEKVRILREHLLEQIPISDICEKYQVSPNQYYTWQRLFFENGQAALKNGRDKKHEARRIEALEAQLAHKDEVIAEVAEAFVQLKKQAGGS